MRAQRGRCNCTGGRCAAPARTVVVPVQRIIARDYALDAAQGGTREERSIASSQSALQDVVGVCAEVSEWWSWGKEGTWRPRL